MPSDHFLLEAISLQETQTLPRLSATDKNFFLFTVGSHAGKYSAKIEWEIRLSSGSIRAFRGPGDTGVIPLENEDWVEIHLSKTQDEPGSCWAYGRTF